MDQYPSAFLAMGNGDLTEVTDFTVNLTNGAKIHNTLRKPGAGVLTAPPNSTCSFNGKIPETGPERNFWKDCIQRKIKQLRAKLPGGVTTLVLNGSFSEVNVSTSTDDGTTVACTFVCSMEPPEI
jgi:hypothetical protein